jgi:predicted dehydrogenase
VALAKEVGLQARKEGISLGVVHNYAFLPGIMHIDYIIKRGKIGAPFLYRAEFLSGDFFRGVDEYDPYWRIQLHKSGGGCVLDNVYHFLYLAEILVGSPVQTVYAQVRTINNRREVEDLALIMLNHLNGALTSLQSSWAVLGKGSKVHELHGVKGSLRCGYSGEHLEIHVNEEVGSCWREIENLKFEEGASSAFISSFICTLDDFARTLSANLPPTYGIKAALHTLSLVEAAYQSAQNNQPVTLLDGGVEKCEG